MNHLDESGSQRDAAPSGDLDSAQRWLEITAPTLFPPECAVTVQRYDSPSFVPHPADMAAMSGAVEKRQREFAAGRAAARAGLKKLGRPDSFIGVGSDRSPLWPAGLVGSITHTNGLAVVVVARREQIAAVGLDLELCDAVNEGLWREILTPTESAWVRRCPGDRQTGLATVIFSVKESFFKLQYPLTGMWVDFQEAEVAKITGQIELNPALSPAPLPGASPGEFTRGLHCPAGAGPAGQRPNSTWVTPPRAAENVSAFSLACSKSAAIDRLGRARFTGCCACNHRFTFAAMHLPAPP